MFMTTSFGLQNYVLFYICSVVLDDVGMDGLNRQRGKGRTMSLSADEDIAARLIEQTVRVSEGLL